MKRSIHRTNLKNFIISVGVSRHFTGKTVESVKQDFHATIFISGLESLLTEDAQEQLAKKSSFNKYPQAVNKTVSFNTIKNHVIELFFQEEDRDVILSKLTELFMTNPICVRKNRQVARKESSAKVLLNYHKRIKKICFKSEYSLLVRRIRRVG